MPPRLKPIKLSPAQSRLAAIVLALFALAIFYLVFLHWWFVAPLLDQGARMPDLRARHARYGAAIAEQPPLQQRLNRMAAGGAYANAFPPEPDPSAARAGLIQRASDVVAAHAHGG